MLRPRWSSGVVLAFPGLPAGLHATSRRLPHYAGSGRPDGRLEVDRVFRGWRARVVQFENDLGEKTNLAELESGKVKELHAAMLKWRKETRAPVPTEKNPGYDPKAVFQAQTELGLPTGRACATMAAVKVFVFLTGPADAGDFSGGSVAGPRRGQAECAVLYSPMINVMKPSARLVTRISIRRISMAGQARNDFYTRL